VFTSSFQLLRANRGNIHILKVSIGCPVIMAGGCTTVYVRNFPEKKPLKGIYLLSLLLICLRMYGFRMLW